MVRIQGEPIDTAGLIESVRDPRAGAVLTFLGTAREAEGERLVLLEYEAYRPMAEKFLAELEAELHARHDIRKAAIVHRVGPVALGEVSIAIAVSSAHRAAGFDALRHAIEAIKEKAPVWKKEITQRGGRWVEVEKMEGG